jgi:calcium binding protein 39
MCNLPFESRKHVAAIFNYFLVCGLDGRDDSNGQHYDEAEQQQLIQFYQAMVKFRDFIADHFDNIMTLLVQGYDCGVSHPQQPSQPDVALHSGTMFRSCMKHESLYELLVCNTERVERYVLPFLDTFVHLPNFEVSSDALESLRLVLTPEALAASHPLQTTFDQDAAAGKMAQLSSDFLSRDYEIILEERLTRKLLSDSANYTTRRVALEILSTLLLSRSNYAIMIRYVSDRSHLISCMHWLRDTSPHITLEAFQVFKIFVANPNKPPDIVKILKDNQVKLCRYLETLHPDREASDEQYREEKALIIQTIEAL